MTVFMISPRLFFFIGLSLIACLNAALYIVKATGGIKIYVRRETIKWVFCVYLLIIAALMLFPVHYTVSGSDPVFTPSRINFVPFSAVRRVIGVFGISQFSTFFKIWTIFKSIGVNFLLMVPLGFMLPQFHKRFHSPARCLPAAIIFSCGIETIQFVETSFGLAFSRAADIDDVLEGVAGAFAGFLIWQALCRKYCGNKGAAGS